MGVAGSPRLTWPPKLNLPLVADRVSGFIRRRVEEAGTNGVVIGLSGGLDSSTTAYLCVRALGPSRVLCLIMPDENVTPKEDVEDAKLVANTLGVEYHLIPITKAFDALTEALDQLYKPEEYRSAGNIRARIRMILLYYAANALNRLVAGTSDKSEVMIGYFTKYGDGAADLLPMGNLYKTQVKELARFLGVPKHIVAKPSSPRLWRGQTAEQELGLSYEVIDPVLYASYELGMSSEDVAKELNVPLEVVERVKLMVERSAHKRSLPPMAEL